MKTKSGRLSTPDPHSICLTRCSSGNGPERALEANTKPPAQSAKDHPSLSLLSERRPDAAEPRPPKPQRSGVRPERALEANTLNPLAQSAKDHPSLSLLSERRPDAAQPTPNAYQDLSPFQPTHQPDSVLFSAHYHITVYPPV